MCLHILNAFLSECFCVQLEISCGQYSEQCCAEQQRAGAGKQAESWWSANAR